ncbi:HIT domain protein [Candidatus Tiddalikarchaeum anstoanum]|nr:HIT domain protein [Candidatus Tiddalikarchaeum anstoanum]
MNKTCIFCSINSNDVPSYTIYEDDLVRAILDVNPVSEGHTLIIPKKHYTDLMEMPDEFLERIIIVAKKLSLMYKNKLKCTGINLLNANGKDAQQSVFHFHMHLVPRYDNDGLNMWMKGKIDVSDKIEDVYKKLMQD